MAYRDLSSDGEEVILFGKKPDWMEVERQYRFSTLSIREIARRFEISDTAIRKQAKKKKWEAERVSREALAPVLYRFPCYIYAVHEVGRAEVCKVGFAAKPFRRLLNLQVGTWRPLTIGLHAGFEDKESALRVEAKAHSELKDVHLSGEWFRANPSKIWDVVSAIAGRYGVVATREN